MGILNPIKFRCNMEKYTEEDRAKNLERQGTLKRCNPQPPTGLLSKRNLANDSALIA